MDLPCAMKLRMSRFFNSVLIFAVLILPVSISAQYVVHPSVLASGGGHTSSGSYAITSTLGQSSPVGSSSGGSFVTNHGFWHAVMGDGPLIPMVLDISLVDPTTAQITWEAEPNALYYDLYRSSVPHFTSATGTFWTTVNHPQTYENFSFGIGDPNTNYYFRGQARNNSSVSPESNIVGEFDFGSTMSATGMDNAQR